MNFWEKLMGTKKTKEPSEPELLTGLRAQIGKLDQKIKDLNSQKRGLIRRREQDSITSESPELKRLNEEIVEQEANRNLVWEALRKQTHG